MERGRGRAVLRRVDRCLLCLSYHHTAGAMSGAGFRLRWAICGALLLFVAGPVLCGRSGGPLRRLFGGFRRGGHYGKSSGHGCRFDWNAVKTARLGSHGLQRFIAAKAGHMAELCKTAAVDSSYCDCRPAWQCPHHVTGPHGRTCRLPGHGLGYCCQAGRAAATVTVTSIVPTTVVTSLVTTTYTLSITTTPTPTTRPPFTIATPSPPRCRPLVLCPEAVADPSAVTTCRLPDGSLGVLCPETFPGLSLQGRRPRLTGGRDEQFVLSSGLGDAPASLAEAAQAEAARVVQEQAELEATLEAAAADSLESTFSLNSKFGLEEAQQGVLGLLHLLIVTNLQRQTDGGQPLLQPSSSDPSAAASAPAAAAGPSPQPLHIPGCEPKPLPICEPGRYRTVSGECNNLLRPRQGRAMTGFKRLLPSTFHDGVYALRNTSVTGRPLPSARLVSERVVETISRELSGFTLSVMQWGQFIDHDLDHALIFRRMDNGQAIQCCPAGGREFPLIPLHQHCAPIQIPAYDPFYSRFGQRCMSFVRSMPAPQPDCIARPATPINELSAYLDAGNVYGDSAARQAELRAFSGGLLRTSAGHLLPMASPEDADCVPPAEVCYRAGDSRVNEQSGLAVMHTLLVREHNRVASALRGHHPFWNDERLFQEARRIVTAEWQHIIYNEWLPIVVGLDYARDLDLLPLRSGFSTAYDPNVDASVSNEFATAAFRYGHSLVREMYDLISAHGSTTRSVNLATTFFNPTVVSEALVDHARTLVASRPETFDTNIAGSLHERLFTSNFLFGFDLIALNIQRGRDHGIPTYVDMLSACTDISVTSWSDLSSLMESRAIDQLRAVYADVRDVDLFIGGLSERRARGAQVGPTFQCLIGQQFFDARYGDRFFYDNGGMEHSFSAAQLAEIRKSSWARIMCDTLGAGFGGDFSQVQPLAFRESGVGPNFVVRCDSQAIPTVDLGVF